MHNTRQVKTFLHRQFLGLLFSITFMAIAAIAASSNDPLLSWNDGKSKSAIIAFVKSVTNKQSPNFVPEAERIATFDNDGTLWSEKPMYSQVYFAFDRVKAMAKDHPEWKTTEPFKSVLANDMKGVMATGMKGLEQIVLATHSNVSAEVFYKEAQDWLATAKNPEKKMLFTEMTYQPMLELLAYLRANGFKTFVASAGGVDFMRVFTEKLYGVPPEQVVGSSLDAKFEMKDGIPTIIKTPKGFFDGDKEGKSVGIYQHIGRKPIFAAGNSDGDLEMLEYTTITGDPKTAKARFGMIVHHTDAKREWAYDRNSSVGHLDKALDASKKQGWTVVDMKNDWKTIYPSSKK